MTHTYRWRKYVPALFGQRCRVIARGKMNSVLIEFESGLRHVVSRFAIRKIAARVSARRPVDVSGGGRNVSDVPSGDS